MFGGVRILYILFYLICEGKKKNSLQLFQQVIPLLRAVGYSSGAGELDFIEVARAEVELVVK